jgi:hypothetical protein
MKGKKKIILDQTCVTKAEFTGTKRNKFSQWFGFLERNIPALAFKWPVRSYPSAAPLRTSIVVTFLSACRFCVRGGHD